MNHPGCKGYPKPDRDQLHSLWFDDSLRVIDIANRYGVSDATVAGWAKRFGFPRRQGGIKPVIDRSREEEFRRLWLESEIPIATLAKDFGCSKSVIVRWADKLGLGARIVPPNYVPPREVVQFEEEAGPLPGDPTPEQIADICAYLRAARVIAGQPCYVYIQQPLAG